MKSGLPLTKNVTEPLAKHVIIPLLLIAVSMADVRIDQKVISLGTRTLIVSNKEMEDFFGILLGINGIYIEGTREKFPFLF